MQSVFLQTHQHQFHMSHHLNPTEIAQLNWAEQSWNDKAILFRFVTEF